MSTSKIFTSKLSMPVMPLRDMNDKRITKIKKSIGDYAHGAHFGSYFNDQWYVQNVSFYQKLFSAKRYRRIWIVNEALARRALTLRPNMYPAIYDYIVVFLKVSSLVNSVLVLLDLMGNKTIVMFIIVVVEYAWCQERGIYYGYSRWII